MLLECKKTFWRPRTGELTALPRHVAGGEGAGFPLPKDPTRLSALWASGFGSSGLTPGTK